MRPVNSEYQGADNKWWSYLNPMNFLPKNRVGWGYWCHTTIPFWRLSRSPGCGSIHPHPWGARRATVNESFWSKFLAPAAPVEGIPSLDDQERASAVFCYHHGHFLQSISVSIYYSISKIIGHIMHTEMCGSPSMLSCACAYLLLACTCLQYCNKAS